MAGLAAVPGDLDADGKVSVADHLLLQQHLSGARVLTPAQTAAADLDGNGTLTSADLTSLRDVLLERFPPAVIQSSPANRAILNELSRINLTFNKRFHDDGNLAAGLNLIEAGPDRHLGTADDFTILGSIAPAPPALGFDLGAPAGLGLTNGPGTYGLSVGAPIADFQGRPMVPFAARFLVLGDDPARDSDFDGIPDHEEITLQTSPLLADTDGDLADDLLERDSGTDPLDPESIPGEWGNVKFVLSETVSYANLAHPAEETGVLPADWVAVYSPVVGYANLAHPAEETGNLPADWVAVYSPVVGYANLAHPAEETGNLPADWVAVYSPVVGYANLTHPAEETGNLPADWVAVYSPVVGYANLAHPPVETWDPAPENTVTVASPAISYQNGS